MNMCRENSGFRILHICQKDVMEHEERIPELENNSIHVWTACYADPDHFHGIFPGFLSRAEQEKASTFRKPADGRRYILRHGMVRFILGNYLLSPPGSVPLVTGRNGKPGLDLQPKDQPVTFSVSHTGEMMSIGVMKKFNMGIDIVKIDPRCPIQEIADYLFCPQEIQYLQGTQPDRKQEIFFALWAMKEAVIKATGEGLPAMRDTDVISIVQDPRHGRYRVDNTTSLSKDFFIFPFVPAEGYRGAVAVCLSGEKQDFRQGTGRPAPDEF
jgi:4'-phosphopantetheinyl transferase